MGIRLDWEVEAEHAYQRATEDPSERSRRRYERLRIMLFTSGVLVAICAVAAAIWFRLYTVDQQQKRELTSVVQAEAATIRSNNYLQFMAIQRTAPGGNWYQEQATRFTNYQALRAKADVNLTGSVLDVTLDDPRGRAIVEEVINGVPYHGVWFYWHFGDGWHHVPSDYTFWGDDATIAGKASTINYKQFDSSLAQALAPRVEKWWAQGCGYLGCGEVPKLTVVIDPASEAGNVPRWKPEQPNTLVVRPPLALGDWARADVAIDPNWEDSVAQALFSRLFDLATNNLQLKDNSDAAWLRKATIDWLAATSTGRGDPAQVSFIQSLLDHYGTSGLIALVHALKSNSEINVVGEALNQPIQALALDWRTFFQWRLSVEKTLLNPDKPDIAAYERLWDTANPAAKVQMDQRRVNRSQNTPQVQAVTIAVGSDGVPRATVQTTANGLTQVIIFRLVDGVWKRSA